MWLMIAWLLWSASGGAWWMRDLCFVHIVWVGVLSLSLSLSLCGGDTMSGLLPRIYPYDSVSCTYQNFMHSFD